MNVLPFVHVSGIAISIKLLSFGTSKNNKPLRQSNSAAQAELEMLKAQLHPHFLFNTLNNLYAFTLERSPKAPEIVLKLSALLRFMIYESNARFISLNEEIDLLRHYIELEKLRYGDRLDISFVINGRPTTTRSLLYYCCHCWKMPLNMAPANKLINAGSV